MYVWDIAFSDFYLVIVNFSAKCTNNGFSIFAIGKKVVFMRYFNTRGKCKSGKLNDSCDTCMSQGWGR